MLQLVAAAVAGLVKAVCIVVILWTRQHPTSSTLSCLSCCRGGPFGNKFARVGSSGWGICCCSAANSSSFRQEGTALFPLH